MVYGYSGTILHVNLTSNRIWKETMSESLISSYLGGRGINAKLLWDLTQKGVDALGEDNVLIFGAGVMGGTHAPSSGRTTVTFKSPVTELYAKSNGGGHWGAELKLAGYDHIVIHGRSPKPVYLWIDGERVELRDAGHLWGTDVPAADKQIKNELNTEDIQTACIGPAGENLVNFAAIMMTVYCAAARAGGGAVMGAKKLKAIAVKGEGNTKVYNPKMFDNLVKKAVHDLKTYPSRGRLSEYGTSSLVPIRNEMHLLPTKNYQEVYLENGDKISGQYIKEKGYLDHRSGCTACATGCHRYTVLRDGKYAGSESGGPEYETVASLGAGCGITDTEAVLKAAHLCNEYGLDTISTGGVIQWAMECYEKGLISLEDTGGIPLEWGNGDVLVSMVEQIAKRKNLGNILAEGVVTAARVVKGDSWKWAMHVKGLEYSRAEIRARMGYALALAVNPRGADHLHSQVYAEFGATPEARKLIKRICGDEKYADVLSPDKKADIVRWHEDCYVVSDCLGLCTFSTLGHGYLITPEVMAEQYYALTGHKISSEDLMKIGRRVMNLEKAFNVREGAERSDDYPPWRFFNEPINSGPYKGKKLEKEVYDSMLDDYYHLHGWSQETGWPTERTLKELGLEDVAKQLKVIGRLGV